jgi:Protein of unknown function (DUF664)
MSDTERGWVRQTFRGGQIPDLYYRSDAPDADFQEADPARAEEDFGLCRAECQAVDAALEAVELDETFTSGPYSWRILQFGEYAIARRS